MRSDNTEGGRLILAVSEDAAVLQSLRAAAEAEGCQVFVLDAATETLVRAKALQPFAVLLDPNSAGAVLADGVKLLEALKSGPYTAVLPVILALPPDADEEIQLGVFRRGADECLVRSRSTELTQVRLQSVLRRWRSPVEATDRLMAGGVTLDLMARKVSVDGETVAVTRKEFDLLNMLLRRRGTVVYTTQLYHTVWGHGNGAPVDAHTVKVHVSSLRGKLGRDLGRKIVNLPGLGYRFDE